MWSKLDYIHLNPVKVGVVENTEHYMYSSARNYINKEGILSITLVDNPVIEVLKKSSIKKLNQE